MGGLKLRSESMAWIELQSHPLRVGGLKSHATPIELFIPTVPPHAGGLKLDDLAVGLSHSHNGTSEQKQIAAWQNYSVRKCSKVKVCRVKLGVFA